MLYFLNRSLISTVWLRESQDYEDIVQDVTCDTIANPVLPLSSPYIQ